MCNATFRPLITFAIILSSLVMATATLSSCSKNSNGATTDSECNTNSDKVSPTFSARGMISQAEQALQSRNFGLALQLADSVHKMFPTAINDRREALHLSTIAKEGLLTIDLARADSAVAATQASGDNALLNKALSDKAKIEQKLKIARSQVERTAPSDTTAQ